MNKSLALILAATAASFCLAAQADDTTTTSTTSTTTTIVAPDPSVSTGLTHSEAKDLKIHSNADYKASKKIADAQLIEDKADCKSETDGAVKRACNSSAKAQAKKNKADAKVVHEVEKSDIKANTN